MSTAPSFRDIARALAAAIRKQTGRSAPEALISWRLSVCDTCPRRRSARTATEKASVALSGQFADKDVCDVCGCSLALLTSSLEPHEDSPKERADRPAECWVFAE